MGTPLLSVRGAGQGLASPLEGNLKGSTGHREDVGGCKWILEKAARFEA